MITIWISFIPAALTFLFALPCILLVRFLYQRSQRGRRSPISGLLLRTPGQSLIPQIDELTDNISLDLVSLFIIPILIYAFAISQLYFSVIEVTYWVIVNYALIVLLMMLFVMRKLSQHLLRRNHLRLAFDAEMAVGQEVNHLMYSGCRVYHDFPAENFNIDHVVVGPGGVIAVETKGRAKPEKGRGSVDATVIYDGQVLRFPDWHETAPLEQARRQAEWLKKWICSAIGEPVAVRPALALPGWFVERTQYGNVIVFNGKNPQFLARPLGKNEPLSEKLVKQIAHQIEQRCRDVAPAGYRKSI